jgi:hypothetical protein
MNLFTWSDRAARAAAVLAAIGFAGIAVFQVALAAGAPWGHAAWGGANANLSRAQRTASTAAVLCYAAAALIVLGRAGIWRAGSMRTLLRWATWILVWGPTALLLAILCTVVARSTADPDQQ